ncbi:MAG: FAD-dependent oxidoreductase [Clostridia bacterium]|nr:FAD-dependent oxidoreductase [Clostridia bacterium]
MNSLWTDTAEISKFDTLNGDINTDVLIIGGGMAGILCANTLQNAGIDYVLVEAQTLCNGITKNTTAKITSQHGLIYDKLIKSNSIEKAKLYLEANQKALASFTQICKDIDCDFEHKDSYVYSIDDREKIETEVIALKKIGVNAKFTDNLPLPFSVAGAVRFKNQAQFNPLKFISQISKGLNIYENTKVCELIGTVAITGHGKIKAKKIIVATHFPFINKHGSYYIKMYQHRSYVLALENAQRLDGMYVDELQSGLSFRNYDNLLLLGGGSHRTGKKGGNFRELREFAKKYYPNAKEKYFWATQDCMTLDGIPYIGRYSANTENLYVATGFNKWGMTSSMVSAMILCDMVQGKNNPYTELFSPSRSILHPQLCINAFESAVNLLTPAKKRCPHLGCALKWNSVEHTWDCPCHGSRFDKDGKLIDNPSTGDLK